MPSSMDACYMIDVARLCLCFLRYVCLCQIVGIALHHCIGWMRCFAYLIFALCQHMCLNCFWFVFHLSVSYILGYLVCAVVWTCDADSHKDREAAAMSRVIHLTFRTLSACLGIEQVLRKQRLTVYRLPQVMPRRANFRMVATRRGTPAQVARDRRPKNNS